MQAEVGTLFFGIALQLLALSLFFLAALAAAITLAWIRGSVPMPSAYQVRPDPGYKGQLLLRYWYFVAPALICLLLAFILAKKGVNPPFQSILPNGMLELT